MTIYADVWPTNRLPEKSQIEQMYKIALRLDPAFWQPEDGERFGLDLERVKQYQAVEMKESLDRLRKQVPKLWARMNKAQKTMFLMSYINSAIIYLTDLLDDLDTVLGKEIPGKEKIFEGHSDLAQAVTLELTPDLRNSGLKP